MLLGVGTGLLNGLIRTLLNIPSFIVTLAMLTAYRSLALIVSNGRPMSIDPAGSFYTVTGGMVFHVPWLILWMFAVTLLGGIVLSQTRFGYHAYATGGNLEAARDAGINTKAVKLIAFAITGGLCGLAAALLFGYLHVAEPTTGTGFEFRVIGAVVVGGAALTGGRGTVLRHPARYAHHRRHHRGYGAPWLLAGSGRHCRRHPYHRGRDHRPAVAPCRRPPITQGHERFLAKGRRRLGGRPGEAMRVGHGERGE